MGRVVHDTAGGRRRSRGADLQVERGDSLPALLLVAGAALAVSGVAAVLGARAAGTLAFELLASVGLLLGLGVAFGGLDRRWRRHRASRRLASAHTSSELAAEVEARLRRLDPVEHRRLELGAPWPSVIVGPTGVHVVAVADGDGRAAAARLEQVHDGVVDLLAADHRRHVATVRALLVVPTGGRPRAVAAPVRTVLAEELDDTLARGALLPMAAITDLFQRLNGALARDQLTPA